MYPNKVYQVFIKTINGKTIVIDIDDQIVSAEQLKKLIEQREGIPPIYQRLNYGVDNIPAGTTINLSVFTA
jgi:hypothetical protein